MHLVFLRHRVLAALGLGACLAGCPDAERGRAVADDSDGRNQAPEGTNADGGPPGATVGGPAVTSLAALSGHIAVTKSSLVVATADGIFSVPKSGGSPVRVVPGAVTKPIKVSAERLYYVQDVISLDSVRHDGTAPVRLTKSADALTLALDAERAFWVSNGDTVESITVGDASVTTLRGKDGTDPVLLGVTEKHLVLCIADPYGKQRIVRRPKNGPASAEDTVLAQTERAVALVTEGGQAYWLEAGSGIRAVDVDGSSASPRRVEGAPAMFDGEALALDATHVYWTSRSEGRIYRAPRATGSAEVIADGFDFPDERIREVGLDRSGAAGRIAVDADALYVSDGVGLFRVPKP